MTYLLFHLVLGFVCIALAMREAGGVLPHQHYIACLIFAPAIVLSVILIKVAKVDEAEDKILDYMGREEHEYMELLQSCGIREELAFIAFQKLVAKGEVSIRYETHPYRAYVRRAIGGRGARNYQPGGFAFA
jgi:hypothetical protein